MVWPSIKRQLRIASCFLAVSVPCLMSAREVSPKLNAPILDVLRVSAEGEASEALVIPKAGEVTEVDCDIVIVGAGLGGVSVALSASTDKVQLCMTEPTRWAGGQATSQGVSAFDDNKWTDTTAGTASYLDFSKRIRMYYAQSRRNASISMEKAIQGPLSNPGGCWVGRLCFEPSPAQKILQSMLQPSIERGQLRLWLHTVPVSMEREGRSIKSVLVYDFDHDAWIRLHGEFFVEATEMGDLLAVGHLPFRIGAEAHVETHERDAPLVANPRATQSFTYPFLLERKLSAVNPIEQKTVDYDTFLSRYSLTVDYGHGKLLTYGFFESRLGLPGSFWEYRRSVDASLFRPDVFAADRSMINWSSNDYCDVNLLSDDPLLQARALQNAKRVSLGFAWWIRHAVPRDDGRGSGYPELTLVRNAMGSEDGLSQHPYIRESRRIYPLRTIIEEDLAVDFQSGSRAAHYPDSVGIGWYPIDIHSCGAKDFTSQSKPYEIPLGSLVDRDVDNLMAVGKTIGTTHITNGAYRLHPTEWATGEAVGMTLVWSLEHNTIPARIDSDPAQLYLLQRQLVKHGQPIFWFDDLPVAAPEFVPLQLGASQGWWRVDRTSLHAMPVASVDGESIVVALHSQLTAATATLLRAKKHITWEDLSTVGLDTKGHSGKISRIDFARWMILRTQ